MTLTNKQTQALNLCIQRYKNKEKYSVISGYAGSGKSVTIKFIIDALVNLGLNPELDICNIAPTGKAATLLAKKGNPNCMTLHKLLYYAKLMPNGKYSFKLKEKLEYKVIICDEASMLTQSMINQLLQFPVYIIFCGDPFQLEPINKNDKSTLLDNPHIFLDEVLRQAQESEIIRLSMDIREGKELKPFIGKEVQILGKKDYFDAMLSWSDISICATNNTRIKLNQINRSLLNYQSPIEDGERLIFLRNYWDVLSDKGYALTNGIVGNLYNWTEDMIIIPDFKNRTNITIPVIKGEFYNDNKENYGNIILDKQCLLTGTPLLSDEKKYQLKNFKELFPLEATYGYAATCWKFQGDQAPKVLGFEENFPFGLEHQKYLYTLVTRAQEKLVLIKNK